MRAVGQAQMLFERGQDVVPQRGFFGGLNLGQIQDHRGPDLAQGPLIVNDVEHGVDDGCGKAGAAGVPHVAVVEMQTARPKDLGREVELLRPVVDNRAPEETLRPMVHFSPRLARQPS